jgi:DNA-binding CsgD family transcriptional regulator
MKSVYLYHPQPFISSLLVNFLMANFPDINFIDFDNFKNKKINGDVSFIFFMDVINTADNNKIKLIKKYKNEFNIFIVTRLDEVLVRSFVLLDESDVVISGCFEWSDLFKKFVKYSIFNAPNLNIGGGCFNCIILTKRQNQILILLALGRSNFEMADMLKITEATVKVHLTRLYKKLDVKNRMQAVIAGRNLGFISP